MSGKYGILGLNFCLPQYYRQYVIMIQYTFIGFGLTLNTIFNMWVKFLKNAIFEILIKILFVNKFETLLCFSSGLHLTDHAYETIW